jgi:hypothetical protein
MRTHFYPQQWLLCHMGNCISSSLSWLSGPAARNQGRGPVRPWRCPWCPPFPRSSAMSIELHPLAIWSAARFRPLLGCRRCPPVPSGLNYVDQISLVSDLEYRTITATYRVPGSIRSSTFSKARSSLRLLPAAPPFQRPALLCGFRLQLRLFEGPRFAAAFISSSPFRTSTSLHMIPQCHLRREANSAGCPCPDGPS